MWAVLINEVTDDPVIATDIFTVAPCFAKATPKDLVAHALGVLVESLKPVPSLVQTEKPRPVSALATSSDLVLLAI